MNEPDEQPAPDPWGIAAIEPTTLVGLWSGDDAPTLIELRAAIASWLVADVEVVDELDAGDPSVLWNAVVEVPGRRDPVIFWAEPAGDVSALARFEPAVGDCRWTIGAETLLDPDDPAPSLIELLRLLTEPLEAVVAVIDANCSRLHPRAELDARVLADTADPPADLLWIIRAVTAPGADAVRLHTQGLSRCGRPELELLDVPTEHAAAASELLNTIAGRLLEEIPPDPGEALVVAPGLAVTLQPRQRAAGQVPRDADEDRDERAYAVVCAAEPAGPGPAARRWPEHVIRQLEAGGTALYLPARETQRQARLARRAWPDLAAAFTRVPRRLLRTGRHAPAAPEPGGVRFLIKASLDAGGDDHEHLWFVARRFDGERAEAELINDPLRATGMRAGDVRWIDRGSVSGWTVVTPDGVYGPAHVEAMSGAVAALAGGPGGPS